MYNNLAAPTATHLNVVSLPGVDADLGVDRMVVGTPIAVIFSRSKVMIHR